MNIYHASKSFPKEERYSLTDQVRRSSRSVCANLAEAEAAETQVWLEFSVQCGYLKKETGEALSSTCDYILGKIVSLINNPQPWLLPGAKRH
jgi:hypothetical protein